MRDGHAAQHLLHFLFALLLRYTEVGQRQFDVLFHVQLINQIETLEHKAYLSLAHLRALALLELPNVLAIEEISATGWIVKQTQDIQQS